MYQSMKCCVSMSLAAELPRHLLSGCQSLVHGSAGGKLNKSSANSAPHCSSILAMIYIRDTMARSSTLRNCLMESLNDCLAASECKQAFSLINSNAGASSPKTHNYYTKCNNIQMRNIQTYGSLKVQFSYEFSYEIS